MDKPVIKTDPNTSSLLSTLIWQNGDFWRRMLFPSQATEITLKGILSGGKVPYRLGSLHRTKGSILQAWWHHRAAGPELRLDRCLPTEYLSAPIRVCCVWEAWLNDNVQIQSFPWSKPKWQGPFLACPGASLLWSDTRARSHLNSNREGPLQTAHAMALMWVKSMCSGVCPLVVLLLWPFGWLTQYLWVLVSAAVEYNAADSFGPVNKESAWHAAGTQ